ncbi:AMP-binding enzyme family protein [Janthinobacterium agaricidamnosum NBRC 102515 = DSM 9628]|uniref:AMP-binding enzyme family protein n=1 Tax=Janthinobacterium agaricidamnosum NBRC 102515 = DSM 9628 TaxID=1349767 RepID=W0V562_9BURK|nr:AMP-binding enzyme family protein [Janthinobacterium agaricidamnosum NBRC 102515 = DSM 9628]
MSTRACLAPEVDTILGHSGARRVLYIGAWSAEAAAHGLRHGALPARTAFGDLLIGPLNQACGAEAVYAANHAQVAALIDTTGTTGHPKGVMLSHRSLLFVAAVSSKLRGLNPADRAYGVLPISHVYGLASVMLGTLYAGACLYLARRYTPDALLHALKEDRLTILQGVPAMYARLLEKPGRPGTPLATDLRFAYAGGAPLAPSLKRDVETLLGVALHNGYSLTESGPTISQTRLDAPRHDSSVGLAIPGVEVRIVDHNGIDVAPGADGNEEIIAFVECDPRHPVTQQELHAYLAQRLSPYKCPSTLIVMDALPAAATGKILKGQLKQRALSL